MAKTAALGTVFSTDNNSREILTTRKSKKKAGADVIRKMKSEDLDKLINKLQKFGSTDFKTFKEKAKSSNTLILGDGLQMPIKKTTSRKQLYALYLYSASVDYDLENQFMYKLPNLKEEPTVKELYDYARKIETIRANTSESEIHPDKVFDYMYKTKGWQYIEKDDSRKALMNTFEKYYNNALNFVYTIDSEIYDIIDSIMALGGDRERIYQILAEGDWVWQYKEDAQSDDYYNDKYGVKYKLGTLLTITRMQQEV